MWETPGGIRKLEGRERAPFVHALLTLSDTLLDSDGSGEGMAVGISVFDQIPLEDRRMVLLHVAERVLGDGPPLPIRAWNAGAVAAVYAHLETMVELEIDSEELRVDSRAEDLNDWGLAPVPPFLWRKMVHEAWMERCFPEIGVQFRKGEGNLQPVESRDLDQWSFKIECLAGELLADDDHEMDWLMDEPPAQSAGEKEYLGIDRDFFTASPPPFSPEERKRLAAFREALLAE